MLFFYFDEIVIDMQRVFSCIPGFTGRTKILLRQPVIWLLEAMVVKFKEVNFIKKIL